MTPAANGSRRVAAGNTPAHNARETLLLQDVFSQDDGSSGE